MQRNLWQFFEDDNNRLSMSRLAVFCTFPMAAYALYDDPSRIDVILGAYVIQYGLGAAKEVFKKENVDGQDSEPTESVQVVSPGGTSVNVSGSSMDGGQLAAPSNPVRTRSKKPRRR